MMNRFVFTILILGLCPLPACETQEDLQVEVQELIDRRVEERRATFISTLQRTCQDKILEEAVRIVDSIIIAEARLKKDTIPKPLRPDRPAVPELKRLKDTSPVSPLFPDSLEADTAKSNLRQVEKN